MTYENAVLAWLKTLLGNDATLLGYCPGGVWRGIAPEGSARPVCLFTVLGSIPDTTGCATAVEEVLVEVAIESIEGDDDADAEAAASRVEALLLYARTTTDGKLVRVRPSGSLGAVPTTAEGTRYYRRQGRTWSIRVSG